MWWHAHCSTTVPPSLVRGIPAAEHPGSCCVQGSGSGPAAVPALCVCSRTAGSAPPGLQRGSVHRCPVLLEDDGVEAGCVAVRSMTLAASCSCYIALQQGDSLTNLVCWPGGVLGEGPVKSSCCLCISSNGTIADQIISPGSGLVHCNLL
jgi:hypothetical protein